jgi:hypothetical protein
MVTGDFLPNRSFSTDQYELSHYWLAWRVYTMLQNQLDSIYWGIHRDRWNLHWKPLLTLPYLTFLLLYAFTVQTFHICTSDSSRDAVCCKKVLFRVSLIRNYISGSNFPQNPNFKTGMSNFQSNGNTRKTCERSQMDEKFKRIVQTNSESENRTVTSFLLKNAAVAKVTCIQLCMWENQEKRATGWS